MTLTIRLPSAAPGRPISPDLFGVFFEDINSAADGGLYAELLQDRPEAWEAVVRDGRNGLRNSGHGGVPVVAGRTYDLTVETRQRRGAEPTARLESADAGVVHAEAEVRDGQAVLSPSVTDLHARLTLLGDTGHGRVSLFPRDTFRGRTNGLRADLAQAVADLKPSFVRFPGGCVAHGLGLDNMYRWQDTIGPLADRRAMPNLWGGHQSMGLGYFEYFQFCEDVGATALPVVAAGVCCQNTPGGQQAIPLKDMGAYVQEVIDLVEYANGPATSPWGARRAEAGHPEPFGLRYLAVGNEDTVTDAFRTRFALLHDALRTRHPEITVIGTVGPSPVGGEWTRGWDFAREQGVEVVDEHAYKSPAWFLEHLDHFDELDRSGPHIYAGEYAARGNTWRCALAEAAWMTAMELNGDVVRLASYAPLLARRGHTQWVPDLIYFDHSDVQLTLNYHVQRMHSANSGDTLLPIEVTGAPVAEVVPAADRRDVRLSATGGTEADFEDLTVTDDTITVRARKTAGPEGFLISFGDHRWAVGGWRNRSLTLQREDDGHTHDLLDPVPAHIETDRWYDLRIEVHGTRIRCHLDGVLVHDLDDARPPRSRFIASAVWDSPTGDLIVKAVNASGSSLDAVFELPVRPVRLTATLLTAGLDDGAPFEPSPAEPRTTGLRPSTRVGLDLPPYSFTVLRAATR
ncbi:alpha-L-arabinofuranosidase C-terminal domain-containing protein [Streptomyces sp. NPDC096311]|uniref:alpha-L-arabinofuranosidase C-terminal domain-containing protein n=1 Tax=Streptomyces sp. NPDC096311 TaxID=3366083 RepID=UPI00382FFFCF